MNLDYPVQSEQLGTSAEEFTAETTTSEVNKSTKETLLDELKTIIDTKPCDEIKAEVESIKIAFYKKHKTEIDEAKAAFVANGGAEENFVPEVDDCEVRLKSLLAIYRQKKEQLTKSVEEEHAKNLAAKQAVIASLKELTESGNGDITAFETFKKLQQEWSNIGQVDKTKLNDLWKTYHLYVENFYNILKVNRELRDLDLKRNFEAKNEIRIQAESLILEPKVVDAFNNLQELHERWREIGPVSHELKEEQWNRFRNASVLVNKRHQDYFEGVKQEQLTNLNLKKELCDKVRTILESQPASRKEWETETAVISDIQKLWKTIGFAPKKDNTHIYEEFKGLCNDFFFKKHEYFMSLRERYDDNLSKKTELCLKAEELQMSEEWGSATAALLELQKAWKGVGSVAKKESDELWTRFRKACDTFFGRKSAHFEVQDKKYDDNLKAKLSIIEELKNFTATTPEAALDTLKEIQNRWGEIGFVSIKMKDKVQNEYRELINTLFKTFKGSYNEHKLDKFKNKVSSIKATNPKGLNQDRERLLFKIKEVEGDIMLWENNIGFFAKSKNAEAMIRDVENKIKAAKESIVTLKEKIKIIDNK
ncbi:MAG: DUF349 domain-containing protein [Rikenellaceae bacterium]